MPNRYLILATVALGLATLTFSPLLSAQQGETITREARPFVPVTDDMLRDPDAGDWLMTHRTYDFQAYSPLEEINRDTGRSPEQARGSRSPSRASRRTAT